MVSGATTGTAAIPPAAAAAPAPVATAAPSLTSAAVATSAVGSTLLADSPTAADGVSGGSDGGKAVLNGDSLSSSVCTYDGDTTSTTPTPCDKNLASDPLALAEAGDGFRNVQGQEVCQQICCT